MVSACRQVGHDESRYAVTEVETIPVGGSIKRITIITIGHEPAAAYLARRLRDLSVEISLIIQRRPSASSSSFKYYRRLLAKRGVLICADNLLLLVTGLARSLPGRLARQALRLLRLPIPTALDPTRRDRIIPVPPVLRPDPGLFGEPWLTCLEVDAINTNAGQDVLRSTKPDLILLAGAPILTQSTIGIARIACLNSHCGITPRYCGNSPAMWALFEREFSQIGYTVHLVVPEVDAGPLLHQELVSWDPSLPLSTLWPTLVQPMYDRLADLARDLITGRTLIAIVQRDARVMPPAGYFAKKVADRHRRQYAATLGPRSARPVPSLGGEKRR
jgi:hypothetical protein